MILLHMFERTLKCLQANRYNQYNVFRYYQLSIEQGCYDRGDKRLENE